MGISIRLFVSPPSTPFQKKKSPNSSTLVEPLKKTQPRKKQARERYTITPVSDSAVPTHPLSANIEHVANSERQPHAKSPSAAPTLSIHTPSPTASAPLRTSTPSRHSPWATDPGKCWHSTPRKGDGDSGSPRHGPRRRRREMSTRPGARLADTGPAASQMMRGFHERRWQGQCRAN